jgi:hypothetical protein
MENKKETTERITWEVNGDTVTVSGTGILSNREYFHYNIPRDRISDSSAVTALVVGNGVTGIDPSVFYHCRNMTSITLPASVTGIDACTFQYCEALLEIHVAADNPVYASHNGILYNKMTGELVQCPCGRQGDCFIPDGVKSIRACSISNCRSLTSITLPASVTDIHTGAFDRCEALLEIQVAADNPAYVSQDGILYNKTTGELVRYPGGRQGDYIIPDGVTEISKGAFSGCRNLTSITIPGSVASIGDHTFKYCCLTSITLPSRVTVIGESAFHYCSSLTSITIPEGVTGIGKNAFRSCDSLTSITIPGSVAVIGDKAFEDCCRLKSVTISEGVTGIGEEAFSYCHGLTSITIPGSVKSIGFEAFACCNLTSVLISEGVTEIGNGAFSSNEGLTSVTIPASVISIDGGAFCRCKALAEITADANSPAYVSIDGVLFSKAMDTLVQYPCGKQGAYVIPDGVTALESYAFADCHSLTSVTIPDSVTRFGRRVFSGCLALTSVVIPMGITRIPEDAFFCCGLTSITIPESVTHIERNAFSGCRALTSISIPESVMAIGDIAFFCSGIKSIVFPKGVTAIEDYMFDYCMALTSVTIPDSVTRIGSEAFCHCKNLTSITLPAGVTEIDKSAFKGCRRLTSITIPGSVTRISDGTFCGCGNLTSITLLAGVTEIGSCAFRDCRRLTSVTIPDSVTRMNVSAFSHCTGLTSIRIPASVTDLRRDDFYPCDLKIELTPDNPAYTSVDGVILNKEKTAIVYFPSNRKGCYVIPDGVTVIGRHDFSNSSDLTSVTIPASVTHIVEDCFLFSRDKLTLILLGHTPPSLSMEGSPAFGLPRNTPIFVPATAVKIYRQAKGWSKFNNIRRYRKRKTGEKTYKHYSSWKIKKKQKNASHGK